MDTADDFYRLRHGSRVVFQTPGMTKIGDVVRSVTIHHLPLRHPGRLKACPEPMPQAGFMAMLVRIDCVKNRRHIFLPAHPPVAT